jgi:conjugal transfer pilin signal peptidase TrbI
MLTILNHIVVVLTPSIDKTILLKSNGDITKGDYVKYHLDNNLVGNIEITKIVGCFQGEKLKYDSMHFYCNGVELGLVKKESKRGDKLEPFTKKNMTIPKGYVYLMGTHKDSFDSRYFGLVKIDNLKKLIPIM